MTNPELLMDWHALFDFMSARGRTFAQRAIGVPADAVSMVEHNCGVQLPTFYVDFLKSAGEDPDRFTPFGPGQDTDFYELVKLLPTERYPCERYWRITRHIDTSVDVHESLFLALERAEPGSTPLVTIALNYSFDPAMVEDLGITLEDAFVGGAFRIFEIEPKPSRMAVHAFADTREETLESAEEARRVLAAMGLQRTFGPTPRFTCFADGQRAASVEVESETMVEISIGAESLARSGSMAEALTATLPNAHVHTAGMRV